MGHVIKSFADDETERIFSRERSVVLPSDIQRAALRKLRMLHNAHTVNDLRSPPGNRLEKLKGARQGAHSIRVNEQWRVCFRWQDGDAYEVELVDYH
jgi:proteic killer suppression protein